MCLDRIRLLVGFRFLFGVAQLLDQAHGSSLEASIEPTAGAGVQDVEELVRREVEESVGGCQSLTGCKGID